MALAPFSGRRLEEEAAYGHLFLLYPVFMIIGAVWWFSEPADPPAIRLIAWALVCCRSYSSTRHMAPHVHVPVRLAFFVLAGALAASLQTGTQPDGRDR